MKGICKDNDKKRFVLSQDCAEAVMEACLSCGIVSNDYAVDLNMTGEDIDCLLESSLQEHQRDEYLSKKQEVLEVILHSRYINLHSLLGHHLSERSYLGIVRNQILVDVQVSSNKTVPFNVVVDQK